MTDGDWEAARDPLALLDEMFPMRGLDSAKEQSRASMLYIIACARRVWHRLPWSGQVLIELADRIVDGEKIDAAIRRAARELAEDFTHCQGEAEDLAGFERDLRDIPYPFGEKPAADPSIDPEKWLGLAHLVYFPYCGFTPNYRRIAATDHSLEFVRDLFPNPFRDWTLEREWRDGNVVGIARGIHVARAFSRLPVLADALEEAGCENEYILDHCRGSGRHVRGCWVIEGILNPPDSAIKKRT